MADWFGTTAENQAELSRTSTGPKLNPFQLGEGQLEGRFRVCESKPALDQL